MTSGTLKLVSLLLVVAAGGGVAWRAHQGILQSDGTSTENESANDDQESAVYEESSSAESSREEISEEDAEPALTAAGWDVENSIGGLSRPPAAVKKFERQMPTKIREASIPSFPDGDEQTPAEEELTQTNADEVSRVGMSESEEPTIDKDEGPSLAGDSDGPAMLPTLISTSTEDGKSEPGASDPFGDQAASDPEEPVAAGTRDSETLEESSPVVLAGNEEPAELPGKVKLAAATENESTESMEDDPFSDSAPPEFSEESDKADKEAEMPAELGEETDPFSEESKPEAEQPSRGGKSLLKLVDEAVRSAIEPAEPPAEEQRSTKSQTTRNDGESTPDLIGGEPIRSRRSSTTKSTEAEPIPTLQPVPDHPRIGQPERDNMRERTSSTRELITDEVQSVSSPGSLDGDGVPEHDVPKGLQQPRLSIEKIAPKQAVLKQPFVYSVLVKNSGSADAHQVTVEDRIPKGTILEGTSPRAELVDKRLVWRLGTIKPDEQKKISIKVIPQEPGPIGSVAKVNFVAEVAAEIEITAPQIVLGVSSPSQVRLGDRLQMVFRVRNAGRADAENVVIRNVIPEGLRHPAGSDLEYAVGTLPAQDSREIKLDLVATKNGKVSNKTIITADGGVNLEEETDVEVVGEQLLLTRTGKTKLFIDRPAVFTSTVANEGTASARKVQVAEVVPAGFEFVEASDNGKFDPATRAVTWTVGPIEPGEEVKLSTKLMPKNAGDYHATVTVTGPAGSVANVDADLRVNGFPAMAVDSRSDTRLISVGEMATIRIQFKNQGTSPARNVVLSAELPPELQLVHGKGPAAWAQEGNLVAFEALEALEPQETAAYELQVKGLAEGDTRIELKISADHLARPLHRDETLRVTPDSE